MVSFERGGVRRLTCRPNVASTQVDEIFGTIQEVFFSVKPADGITAASFKAGDKLFINPEKLLPLQRFLPQPKGQGGGGKGGGKGGACNWTRATLAQIPGDS